MRLKLVQCGLLACLGCGPGGASTDQADEHGAGETIVASETAVATETETESESETETETETESSDESPTLDVPQGEPCEGPDVVVGDLYLGGYSAIQALEGVRCITGILMVSDQLEPVPDLAPLWALEVIGGVFQIGIPETSVDSLVGLDSLTSVGGLLLNRAPATNLDGLEQLEFIGAGGLVLMSSIPMADVDGLASLTWVDGDVRLQDIADIGGLASLTHVGGELWITKSPLLADLDGLAAVVEFDARLVVGINNELADISGLAGLPAATEVHVFSNPQLSTCAVLELIANLEPLEHTFVAGNDDEACQPAEPCAAMDAHVEGPCEALIGPIWYGQSCGYGSGCDCIGKDCVASDLWWAAGTRWVDPEALCETAFAGCP